jgi:hypothetical protein
MENEMNLQGTFVVAMILSACLALPSLAADVTMTPGQSTRNNAASHAIADTVAEQHNAKLTSGFAKGVKEAGGSESLAKEGGNGDISIEAEATTVPPKQDRNQPASGAKKAGADRAKAE